MGAPTAPSVNVLWARIPSNTQTKLQPRCKRSVSVHSHMKRSISPPTPTRLTRFCQDLCTSLLLLPMTSVMSGQRIPCQLSTPRHARRAQWPHVGPNQSSTRRLLLQMLPAITPKLQYTLLKITMGTNTMADDLNVSLQVLPNGAVKEPYVWMWYTDNSQTIIGDTAKTTAVVRATHVAERTEQASAGTSEDAEKVAFDAATAKTGSAAVAAHIAASVTYRSQDIKYPSDSYEGKALYWQSPRTRFPDFNSNANPDKKWHDCGRIDGTEDINNDAVSQAGPGRASVAATKDLVHSTEGLCLYISSGNKITTEKNYRVTYMYNADVYYTNGPGAAVVAFQGQTQVGESVSVVTTDASGAGTQSFVGTPSADQLINGEEAIVTVEEVGLYRYWDVNDDGYPERSYQSCTAAGVCTSTFETHECSKRGICDESTGECRCFSGYTGTSCNAQNAISYSS